MLKVALFLFFVVVFALAVRMRLACYGVPWAQRALKPAWGVCEACRRPWGSKNGGRWIDRLGVEGHVTKYSETEGIFPLCEKCWAERTPKERWPYYEALLDRWGHVNPKEGKKEAVRRAVMELGL